MSYTARSVTAAVTPWTLTIGRWSFTARPVSAAMVLRVLPLLADPATATEGALLALRAAFAPIDQSFWSRLWHGRRDPVRAVLALEPRLQHSIVQQILTVASTPDVARDPLDELIAAHKRMAHGAGKASSRGPSLALAVLTCETRLAGWYFAPDRWPTCDGYAPLQAVWAAYEGLMALDAQEQLRLAAGVSLGMGSGPLAQRQAQTWEQAGYPDDPTVRRRAN